MGKSIRGWWWEALCFAVYLTLAGVQLFKTPIVGVADNGDFPKVLGPLDVCGSNEYYRYIFERVPGLPEAAKAKGLDPLAYMRKFGAFEVVKSSYRRNERPLSSTDLAGTEVDPVSKVVLKSGKALGIEIDAACVEGFPTPSRKQELYSQTLVDWNWP